MKRSMRRIWVSAAVIGVAVLSWNYLTLQRHAAQVISEDPRNDGIKLRARYQWFVNPRVLVFDLRQVSGDNSPLDVTRTLLQFAERKKDRNFDRVILSYKGDGKFQLDGLYFQTLGDEYEYQNPAYTLRTLPENVYELDGSLAFGAWTGGLIGVVGNQMEDLNELHARWYLYELVDEF